MELLFAGASHLGIELTSHQLSNFQCYFEELIDWNSRINLTAITDPNEVQLKHFIDSLTVGLALPNPLFTGYKLIDVGSGGGFPGLPLKIAFPQIDIVLLEATNKKAEFLKHMVQYLALENVTIVSYRAEEAAHLPEYRGQFDVAVARGLAGMSVLVELTLPFCRKGGYLVAQKKGRIHEELEASIKAIEVLGGGCPQIRSIDIPEFTDNRYLVIVEKLTDTPHYFPRRSGVPNKRPLE
jgi:16S rRNA (guanine527-N7)-methyltransferase